MKDIKKLELTKDPLTNIQLMIPMFDDESRKAVSYFMYGCYLGESIAKNSLKTKQLQEA